MDKKIDTIREKYFSPLERMELLGSFLFYISAILSFIILLIDESMYPKIYDIIQISFLLVVFVLCIVSISIRLHFSPRAQEYRYKDFLSHAYKLPLGEEQTKKYYNNNQDIPVKCIAAQTLENSFYSKNTALEMVKNERVKVASYVFIWLVAMLNRSTDLAWISIVAQLVLSEQILSRWLRIEWLGFKFERTFDDIFRLIQGGKDGNFFEVNTLEIAGRYEMAKSNAGITLSSKIFDESKEKMDKEWKGIRKLLGL